MYINIPYLFVNLTLFCIYLIGFQLFIPLSFTSFLDEVLMGLSILLIFTNSSFIKKCKGHPARGRGRGTLLFCLPQSGMCGCKRYSADSAQRQALFLPRSARSGIFRRRRTDSRFTCMLYQ